MTFSDSSALPVLDPRDAPAMALLGHDLRAALSEVIGGLRLIDPAPLAPASRQQIARTKAAGEALALLLEQALTLLVGDHYADAASPPLQTERLFDGIRLRWQARARDHGLGFLLRASTDLPALLPLDAALIERILSNLLGNAIKYAGSGQITCAFGLTADGQLRLRVQDEGPGFAPAALPRLFSGNPLSDQSHKPGSGLGLHIVHEMVETAGGRITAQNRASGGAEITVTLPLPDLAPGVRHASTAPDLSHLRVLVADDNQTSRQLLSQMLASMGAEVVTAADGVQAVGRIERESFDLLLIDIEMPGFNGLEVIRHIRAMPGPVAQLPILAVTAYRLRANKAAIEAVGADQILSKPVLCPITLGETALAVLHGRQARPAPVATAQMQPDRFNQLLAMAGPDLAAELLDRLQEDLLRAERGLLAASHRMDWQDVRAQTHVLMALAGTAGALHLQYLAEEMNALAHADTPDRGTFLTLLPQLLEALDTLIHFVGRHSPDQGGKP
ncbi:MAG: histidine kinase [Rhodobacteraceae bacterium]|nr:MAG: histidine kinase [Paracoccaceae bacterium]